jgi:phospholipid/cholesterol/gamma-HCH transport system ATP-binding protein
MIEFDSVSLCLGNRRILSDISFRVEKGETVVLVGSSGAGKSTILRLILGLIKPTSGRISIAGKDISTLSEKELNYLRQKFSLIFQNGALFDSLTLEENVGFFLSEQSKHSASEIQSRVFDIINFFWLEDLIH